MTCELDNYLVNLISTKIRWAEDNFNLSLLIIHIKSTYKKTRVRSFVKTGFLEYYLTFSLYDILKLKESRKYRVI
jgi:hypothetical protein